MKTALRNNLEQMLKIAKTKKYPQVNALRQFVKYIEVILINLLLTIIFF